MEGERGMEGERWMVERRDRERGGGEEGGDS